MTSKGKENGLTIQQNVNTSRRKKSPAETQKKNVFVFTSPARTLPGQNCDLFTYKPTFVNWGQRDMPSY